jgi:hypothetical protein
MVLIISSLTLSLFLLIIILTDLGRVDLMKQKIARKEKSNNNPRHKAGEIQTGIIQTGFSKHY